AGHEGVVKVVAVDQIRGKHAAKEHDFRDQEDPHPQRRGVFLLLHVCEVVLQHGMVGNRVVRQGGLRLRQRLPPALSNNRKLLRSPPACLQNCGAAAAKSSATPSRSRPTGSARPLRHISATTADKPWAARIPPPKSKRPRWRARAALATLADRNDTGAACTDIPE